MSVKIRIIHSIEQWLDSRYPLWLCCSKKRVTLQVKGGIHCRFLMTQIDETALENTSESKCTQIFRWRRSKMQRTIEDVITLDRVGKGTAGVIRA